MIVSVLESTGPAEECPTLATWPAHTPPPQVLCFILLVLVAIYTANTAANITTFRLSSSIASLSDLQNGNKVVGTWTGYQAELARRGVKTLGLPWNTAADERAMFQALSNGTLQALVLDRATAEVRGGLSVACKGLATRNRLASFSAVCGLSTL